MSSSVRLSLRPRCNWNRAPQFLTIFSISHIKLQQASNAINNGFKDQPVSKSYLALKLILRVLKLWIFAWICQAACRRLLNSRWAYQRSFMSRSFWYCRTKVEVSWVSVLPCWCSSLHRILGSTGVSGLLVFSSSAWQSTQDWSSTGCSSIRESRRCFSSSNWLRRKNKSKRKHDYHYFIRIYLFCRQPIEVRSHLW